MTGNVRGMIAKVYASRCRLVLAVRNGRLGSREADFRVGAVAKRLVGRAAASTHRKWPLRNLIGVAIPIDERDVITFNEIRTVLPDLDVCHLPNLLFRSGGFAPRTLRRRSRGPTIPAPLRHARPCAPDLRLTPRSTHFL